jgi:type I restriction enzyme S subunit
MNNLPKLRFPEFVDAGEWEEKKLGDVAVFFKGKGLPKSAITPNAKNPCIHYGELFTEYPEVIDTIKSHTNLEGDYFLSTANDVLMPTSDVTPNGLAKSCCIKLSEVILGGDILVIQTNKLAISGEFLARYIRYLEKKVLQLVSGSTVFHLYASSINKLALSFPSRQEQQEIADCLSSLDDRITLETQKLDTLKAHKKGLMQQLFPAEGETLPKLRFPEFQDDGEWEDYTLIEIAKFRRGSFPQPYGLPEWYDDENGMPFIQVFDVNDDLRLKAKTKSKISKQGAEQSVYIPKGTLIVTLQGSIGRVAITQYDAYIDRTLLLFESFHKTIEKLFFAYVIQNLFEIEKHKAPGGIIKTITKEVLSDFKVNLPDFLEQKKIADCLSSIDEAIAAQSQAISTLKTHKKGLMQQLFPALDEVTG